MFGFGKKEWKEEILPLGVKYRDKITGFEGVAVGRTEWLYQCNRYGLQGTKLKEDGTIAELQWFDGPQLEAVEEVVEHEPRTNGGPRPAPQRRADPVK